MVVTSIITAGIHFLRLAVARHSAGYASAVSLYSPDHNLTPLLGLDMLAWTFFFGLSLLFGANIFTNRGIENTIRIVFIISGGLCLAGTAGPLTGNLNLYMVAPLGFTAGTVTACILLTKLFTRIAL